MEKDSNLRSRRQQIYSLPPLATRESIHIYIYSMQADDRTRTDNLLITNQLLCQLSHIGECLTANGWRWIRTTEAICSRFTVCPLWPLGNPSIFFLFDGTNRARTYDPLLVRQMLSQLSYDPIQTTQKRLELSTSAVTGRRSNQLSHWAIFCCTYVPSKLHTRNIFFHPTYHLAWSCPRPISISQLHTLLYFHL